MSVPVCHQAAWPQEGTQRCIRCLEELKGTFSPGDYVFQFEGNFTADINDSRFVFGQTILPCEVQA